MSSEHSTPIISQPSKRYQPLTNIPPVTAISCYNRLSSTLIEGELNELPTQNAPTIAAGDFNAKHPNWHSSRTNASGRVLVNYAFENDVNIVSPDEPTRYDDRMGVLPEHLVIALAKNVTHQIRVTTVDELKSDHNPVLMHIGNEANEPEVIRHAKIDWTKFTEDISANLGNIPRIQTEDDLEQAVDWLESKITDSVENATTRFAEPTKRHTTVPQNIVELIRAKNRARRTAHRTG
jgi:hypothetical protein